MIPICESIAADCGRIGLPAVGWKYSDHKRRVVKTLDFLRKAIGSLLCILVTGFGGVPPHEYTFATEAVSLRDSQYANVLQYIGGSILSPDGKFDSSDVAFSSVKLWKDLNQDGVSQNTELFTFAQLGVQSINVTGTASNVNLGGGNTQTFSGSFTRVGGQTGASGTAQLVGSLLLTNNNFYRQFTDDPALTSAALARPQMTGSGAVRDLRPAMSLGTAQALDLQTKLTQFAADATRDLQQTHLDALIQSWGATSAMLTSIQTNLTLANPAAGAGSITAVAQFAQNNPSLYAQITALERFNGNTIAGRWVRASGSTNVVSYSAAQEAFIHQAYDALKESVYGALAVQTRLKPYLDSIELAVDATGVHFDTAATVAMVQGRAGTDAISAVVDLIDLRKYAGETATAVGWQVYQTLGGVLETATITTNIQNLLTAERIVSLGATAPLFQNDQIRLTAEATNQPQITLAA